MSGSVLRYRRRDDGNQELRGRIVDLAHRHRRYGYRMIHLRLRHEGWSVNVKRVRRLYRLENLMVRRRKRKKIPLGEQCPRQSKYRVMTLNSSMLGRNVVPSAYAGADRRARAKANR